MADERAREIEEGLVQLFSSFIPDRQAAVVVEPGHRALHDPTVAPQPSPVLDPLARDADLDAAAMQVAAAVPHVVALVRVQLVRAAAWPAAGPLDRSDRLHDGLEDRLVWALRPGQARRQWEAPAVDRDMPLGARLAAIGRIRADGSPPFFARRLALSTHTRDQSIRSAAPSLSRRTRWRACHTPASCQSRSRRQQVLPLPQPSASGNAFQPMPVLRT